MRAANKSRNSGLRYSKKKLRDIAIKTLNVHCCSDRGITAAYFSDIESGVGCKIFHGRHDTEKGLLSSLNWQNARDEYRMIKRLEYSNMTPKGYGVERLHLGNEWRAVIFMEHIPGPVLYYFKNAGDYAIEYIFKKFRKITGYDYSDNHEHNVVVHENDKYPTGYKYYVIDLDPSRMSKIRKGRK